MERYMADETVVAETEAKVEADQNVILPDDSKGEAPEETGEQKGQPTESETKDDEAEKNRQGYLKRIKQRDNAGPKLETEKQDALNQIGDERDKKLAALEWNNYITKVTQARKDIVSDNEKVQAQIPIFNPGSRDFNKGVYDRAMERYARDSLIADTDGEIVGYRVSLFDYLKEEADLYHAGSATGTKKRSNASARMDAAADTPG